MQIKVLEVKEEADGMFVDMRLDSEAQKFFMELGFNVFLKQAIDAIADEHKEEQDGGS